MPENESCSKVLNFLERLDDTVRCSQAVRGYIYMSLVHGLRGILWIFAAAWCTGYGCYSM